MNDDLVVQKILQLLENNTAFIGYALNGGIGTKINVRNTETGKTIQALSINVDSSGEVLVVKDSDDGKYKAVTFKAAEQITERIIQIRKTKPVDDKKIIEYTEADIEVFYLFVKLIDTGSPYPTQLQSTWIRKGSSCTQFVGAYERCNYAAKETIAGTSYTGLPYKPYSTLNDCLNEDLSRDAKTPHGTSDSNGTNLGWKIYSTKMTADAEESLRIALESHDAYYKTNYKKLFGYASILECSGAMYVQGWELVRGEPTLEQKANGQPGDFFFQCDFGYLPGYTTECSLAMQNAGYCDSRGFINSKTPPPGTPGVGNIDNSWAYTYGWVDLPYDFMYKRHFFPQYVNGQHAQGSFLILEINEDQTPTIPPNYFPWTPGCPSNLGNGGPYNGSGGNRLPDGPPKPRKRDMKLSTHKAEIWLGSSRREEAIKLYELGASDLFSGMYNAFIIKADETNVDTTNRTRSIFPNTPEELIQHEKFYENWNKNIIDLNIDPRVWVYVINNKPLAAFQQFHENINPENKNLQIFIDSLYNRTLNLTVVDKKTQIVHLKLGLVPKNTLSNTDCKGKNNGNEKGNDNYSSQSWEFQKTVTIKVKDWKIVSNTNNLDTTELQQNDVWNTQHINRKFVTSFGTYFTTLERDLPSRLLLRPNSNISLSELLSGNHFEQFNYNTKRLFAGTTVIPYYIDNVSIKKDTIATDIYRRVGTATVSWWELWNKTHYSKETKRLSSIVGYDRNHYQIIKSSGLNPGLNYSGSSGNSTFSNAVIDEDYFEYVTSRPLNYTPSYIRATRNKLITALDDIVADRKKVISTYGLYFYFGDVRTKWTLPINLPPISVPSNYYNLGASNLLISTSLFTAGTTQYYFGTRLDTRRWTNNLWAQLIYDGTIKIDVDSYKNVEFTLPSNPNQYLKYADTYLYTNSEYSFTLQPQTTTDIETVLTPGVLDVTKQVKITKPTNVELDPNMSFLVYIYPFVEVTKKKKEI